MYLFTFIIYLHLFNIYTFYIYIFYLAFLCYETSITFWISVF